MKGKRTEWLRFLTVNQEEILFPLATVTGEKSGPTVTITAGIHGCEYPGIAAAIRLFKNLDPEKLSGEVKIVTVSSLQAFEDRRMFVCPVDNKNPNRFFPGKRGGSYTEAMDYFLFNEVILKSDFYLDLHGGDMVEDLVPFSIYHKSGNEKVDKISLEMAKYYGLPNIITTTLNGEWPDSGTTYANASESGIPGAIVEAGGIGQLDEASVQMHMKGMLNVLKLLGCIEGEASLPESFNYYNSFVWVYTSNKGIFYINHNVGDQIEKGQILGCVEGYFGEELEKIESPVSGRIMFLTTSPAVKEKGLLMGIGR